MTSPERQTEFGWLVAVDLFLAGAGGGVFLISFIMDFVNKYEAIARIGAVLGPILVLVSAFLLLIDLGAPSRAYRLFLNPRSWMSRGTWVLAIFIIFGLAYSLPQFGPFTWVPWDKGTMPGTIIGIIAAMFSVLVLVYGGFLIGVVKGIPFWNTPLSPIVFLVTGSLTGIAILFLIAPFFRATLEQETIAAQHMLGIAAIILIFVQLLILAAYLGIAMNRDVSSAESVHRLIKTPRFFVGVVIVGLIAPLYLLFHSIFATDVSVVSTLTAIASVALLAGGILLRHLILKMGVYLPRYLI